MCNKTNVLIPCILSLFLASSIPQARVGTETPLEAKIEAPRRQETQVVTKLPPKLPANTKLTDAQCISLAMYMEARGESERGRKAVGHVILNRTHNRKMTACQVLFQPKQFSFHRKGNIYNDEQINKFIKLASLMLRKDKAKQRKDFTQASTHYARINVDNYWTKVYKPILVVDNHIFYKKGQT